MSQAEAVAWWLLRYVAGGLPLVAAYYIGEWVGRRPIRARLAAVKALCDKAENRPGRGVLFNGALFPVFVSVDELRAALTGGGDE